jgi:membrane protein YqaA with SNARE-associated domain
MASEGRPDAPRRTVGGASVMELRLERGARLNFRLWFYPFAMTFAALVLLARHGSDVLGPWPHLATLLAYMSLACTFLPLPTTPVVMLAASPAGPGLDPLLVALAATAGTCAANLHDYYLVTFLYRYRPVRRVRRTRFYEKAAGWFERAPFAVLTAASFLPIPVDVVRLLAISQGYPRGRFTLASAVGRLPRYFLLAYFAQRFSLGWQWILAVLGVTAVFGLWRGVPRIARAAAGMIRKETGDEMA